MGCSRNGYGASHKHRSPVLVPSNTSRDAETAVTAEGDEEKVEVLEERSKRRNQPGKVDQNNPAPQSR